MSAAWKGRDELRAMRQVQQIYDCEPRPCYEMLRELAADPVTRQDIDHLLERYARLNPAMVATVGAGKLVVPVFVVESEAA